MRLMLDCKEVARLISDGLDQKLPAADRAQMRLHYVMCRGCRTVDEQMSFMRRAMQQLGKQDFDLTPRGGLGPEDQGKGAAPKA